MSRRAFVVGGMSQSGRLLIKSLLEDGYEVKATTRTLTLEVLPFRDQVSWYMGIDFSKTTNFVEVFGQLNDMIQSFLPHEVYNLASVMYAPASWERPVDTYQVNLLPCVQILHAIRGLDDVAFVQAGSAEMYQKGLRPISLDSPVGPTSPYGISKLAAYLQVKQSREKYGTRACTAVLLNMESPDRDDFFFARRAVLECVRVYRDHQAGRTPAKMEFGPLGARRDWGLAREYVGAMRLMAASALEGQARDRVIGTGDCRTCYAFIQECLAVLGIAWYFPAILSVKEDKASQAYDCMYASGHDISVLGMRPTGFSGVVKELVEGELRKSGEGNTS